jgi:hypothetical protein
MRDINFSAINEDYTFSNVSGVSMKTAGFINTQLRVLTAYLMKSSETQRKRIWVSLDKKVKELIRPFLEHPEARLHNDAADRVAQELYETKKHKGLKMRS